MDYDFDFSRLIVYQRAREYLRTVAPVIEAIPRGFAELRNQLIRASTSITLNIAEGAGHPEGAARRNFYRIARGSASECAAIIESPGILGLNDDPRLDKCLSLLAEVTRMLYAMIARLESTTGPPLPRPRTRPQPRA